jgi:transcriptional regulator with XRE-family HTH domain
MTTTRIGDRIKIIQGTKSQNKFARDIGVRSCTLGRWKSGKSSPQLEDLEKICEICNLNLAWLAAGEGPMYKTDQPYNPAIAAPEELKGDGQKQIEPLRIIAQEFISNTDQSSNPAITVPEHDENERKQIAPPQVAPQEPQGMPFMTQLAVFCGVLAIFFALVVNKSEVDFFKNYSVFGLLLSCVIGYFCIALPHIEDWFYPTKNLEG